MLQIKADLTQDIVQLCKKVLTNFEHRLIILLQTRAEAPSPQRQFCQVLELNKGMGYGDDRSPALTNTVCV